MNAIYVRVSSEEQAKSGYSLQDQLQVCRQRLLNMAAGEIKEYIDDGYSGEYLDRPALDNLRNDLRDKHIEQICIYDPDRLSRNLTNQLLIADEIEKAGAILCFVTGDYDASPEGRLFFSIRGAISAFEKAKIRERTQRGRKAKANSGKIVHNAHPYGFDFDQTTSLYMINVEEAAIVRLIYAMCTQQAMGARAITRELARQGITNRKTGKPLSVSCVENILTKDMYYGQHYQFRQAVTKTGQTTREIKNLPRETWIPVTIPPIIDYATYQRAQAQRQKNKHTAKRNTTHEYLLQGILHCALCGRSMTACSRSGSRKKTAPVQYSYYSCITNESNNYLFAERCRCRRIPAGDFDQYIWSIFVNAVKDSRKLPDCQPDSSRRQYCAEIAKLTTLETQLLNKQAAILTWFHEDIIAATAANKELLSISRQLNTVAASLASLRQEAAQLPATDHAGLREAMLAAKTFGDRQAIIRQSGITIYAARCDDIITVELRKT